MEGEHRGEISASTLGSECYREVHTLQNTLIVHKGPYRNCSFNNYLLNLTVAGAVLEENTCRS